MEPIFISFDKLTFDDKKRFILKFSKTDEIKKVLFSNKNMSLLLV